MNRQVLNSMILIVAVITLALAACSTGSVKERKKERERLSQQSKFTCEFVNAEIYPDIEVELNLQMAKKCDPEKPFSMTGFKTPSENQGVMFCCSLSNNSVKPDTMVPPPTTKPTPNTSKETKKEDGQ